MINGAPINILDYGADPTGTNDSTAAIQSAIDYARDNNLVLEFPSGNFRITSTLNTQHDTNYKPTNWVFSGGIIVADFDGSPALNVTGGVQVQSIQGIVIQPSTAYAMNGSNYDTNSHGIYVSNTRVDIQGTIQNFKGYGYNHQTTALNSNSSVIDLTIYTCNFGFFANGADDNFAVVRATLKIYGCAQSAFFATQYTNIRNWVVWINAENNCTAVTTMAAVYVWQSIKSNWWIYCEQQNAANEIDFSQPTNVGNFITSARYNKDTYANGNIVYGAGLERKNWVRTWTPQIGGLTTLGAQTYAIQEAYWTQQGNQVTVWGRITLTAKDAATSGNLIISGLPVNPVNSNMSYPMSIGAMSNLTLTAGKLSMALIATPGNAYLSFYDLISGGLASPTPSTNLSGTTDISFSGTYLIA